MEDLPTDTIWHGEWPDGEEGDLIDAAKDQRRKHRKAEARWKTRQANLLDIRSAPAFAAYLAKLREQHLAAKPVFAFVPPTRRFVRTTYRRRLNESEKS